MRNVSFGTPAQFQSKLKEKIQELGGDISACENITANQYTSEEDLRKLERAREFLDEMEVNEVDTNSQAEMRRFLQRSYQMPIEDAYKYVEAINDILSGNISTEQINKLYDTDSVISAEIVQSDANMSLSEADRQNREATAERRKWMNGLDLFLDLYNDASIYNEHPERFEQVDKILFTYGEDTNEVEELFDRATTEDQEKMTKILQGTEVEAANKIDDDTERYLHNLYGDVESGLSDIVSGFNWDLDTVNIYLAAKVDGNRIWEYTIPLADLSLSFDTIEKDVAYIVNTVRSDFENDNGEE